MAAGAAVRKRGAGPRGPPKVLKGRGCGRVVSRAMPALKKRAQEEGTVRSFLVWLVAALIAFPPASVVWAQEKPVAAIGRVATLGDVKRSQKRIIANRLETVLSESYDLISQQQYEKAEEAAFDQLDLDQCTEEECIRKIQELLQVDRLFILQIIREPEITQLTLNLMKTDAKRTADAVCEDCSTAELYEKIDELARKLVAQDVRESAQEFALAQPAGLVPQQQFEEEESTLPWWGWLLIGVGVIGLAAAAGSSDSSSSTGDSTTAGTSETGSTTYSW